jgi:hypothetical protein
MREFINGVETFPFLFDWGAIEIPIEFTIDIGEILTFTIAILVAIGNRFCSLPCFSFLFVLFSLDL